MAARAPLVLVLLLLIIVPSSATAGECALAVPKDGPPQTTYGPRAKGRYCDGEPESLHGGGLRILSIMSFPSSPLPTSPPLTLKAPGGGRRMPAQRLNIEGLPLQATRNYRFDASLRSDELPLTIGSEAALWKLSNPLPPAEIGWTAWTQVRGEERIYWPLSLDGTVRPGVRIVLRSSIQVAALRVVIHEPTGQTLQKDLVMLFSPNEPIPYELPPGPPGVVTIDIDAEGADGFSSQSLSLQLRRFGP